MSETVNTVSGEIATIDEAPVAVATLADKIADLRSGGTGGILSTIEGEGFEAKLAALEAINNSKPIAENLNKVIKVANIIVQPIVMQDEKTGEERAQPRVILIEADGTAYHAISGVLFRDVNDWFALLGQPSEWPEGFTLPVKVVRQGSGTSQFFTAKLTK